MSDDGPARTAAFSYRITCSKHEDDQQTTCFTADAVILDAAGREVAVLPGKSMHAYSEAAEDEAVERAIREIRRLRESPS